MTKQRKKFDTGLKLEVVRMIKEQGLSVQHVSQSMDIGPTPIRRWVAQYRQSKVDGQESAIHSPLSSSASGILKSKTVNFIWISIS